MELPTEKDWLKRWARYSPECPALIDGQTGDQISYELLYQLSQATAEFLSQKYGIASGDRVAVLSKNCWQYVALFYGLQRLGAVMVPINIRLTAREVQHVIQDSEPKLMIHELEFTPIVKQLSTAVPCWPMDGEFGYHGFLKEKPHREFEFETLSDDHPVMILYTSGTTGAPKGALITHKMLFWNSVSTGLRLNLVQSDVQVACLPFFHTGGWNVLLTPFLHRGATSVVVEKFVPEQMLELCERYNVTVLFGVPTMMDRMARSDRFASSRLESVRFAIVGGEPMPLELIKIWQQRSIPIRQGYGLTEYGPNVFSLNEQDSERKMGSIGFPNFYIDTRVVSEHGADAVPGEVGELWLRGPACTPGYWQNPRATEESIHEGWFKTGDLVKVDEEGYFYVVGRKKDMYISGGENVYPAEVEQVLRRHPEVLEAAVIGVPDEKWGEVGKAFVVLMAGSKVNEGDLIQFCQLSLAKFKVPKHVRFLSELPKGESGKILKRALKTNL